MLSSPIYLIDVSHFIFRAYHALPPLENPAGISVGAVYGFLSMILKLLDTQTVHALAIVFDSKTPTFRHKLYPSYKANRPAPPPELSVQFELVKEACLAFGLPIIQCDGFEADDLIATYAHHLAKQQQHTLLVSSDKDLMQLVSPCINMLDPIKNVIIDTQSVIDKFGVRPDQLCDLQALMGDTSDNIPGVPGIGPKTAANLIQSFHTLDGVYDNLENIPKPRLKELLSTHRQNAFLSQKLAQLCVNTPFPQPFEKLFFDGVFEENAHHFLQKHGFASLERRLKKTSQKSSAKPLPWTALDLLNAPDNWQSSFQKKGVFALTLNASQNTLVLFHPDLGGICLQNAQAQSIAHLFEEDATLPIIHDVSALTSWSGYIPHTFDDTFLMAYLIYGPTSKTPIDHHNDLVGTPLPTFTGASPEIEKTLQEAWALWHVFPLLRDLLIQKHLWDLYQTIDKPLIPVLRDMERAGILLDQTHLQKLGTRFDLEIKKQETRIFNGVGRTFNVASPKQLSEILFDTLKLTPPSKKGKSGVYSTNVDVIEKIDHPIKEPLLIFRQLSKLKNTYITGLLNDVDPKSSRVHTTFLSCGTSTGRLASIHPNLQNIPIRDLEGQEIRKAFVAEPGAQLLSIDYSQIELRLLAHVGNVTPLIHAFQKGADIHRQTAAEMFEVVLDQVTDEQRRNAKMINFGIIYGMSSYGLSERLSIPIEKAKLYIDRYFERYPGIKTYMETCIQTARAKGYVTTLWGRRCFTPHIQDKNVHLRAMAERLSINAPLQGTSADLIRLAMVKIHAYLKNQDTSLRLLLQIHDELLFEGPQKEIDKHLEPLSQIMTSVANLQVPLLVKTRIGPSWQDTI